MIMTAFRTSILWGLGVLIPPITIIYLFAHWQDAKDPFKIQMVGLLIIAAFAYMNGGLSAVTSVSSNISSTTFIEPKPQSTPISQHSTTLTAPALDPINQPSVSFNTPTRDSPRASISRVSGQQFKCDGRQHCSQMTSCAEATYFLKNCPNTKMDGDNNGIPCERQWCKD